MTKNSKKYITIISLIIIIYNILVWAIPFPKKDTSTFIISYSASMIALIIQPIIYYIAIHNRSSLKSKLYGLPILRVSYIYVIVQMCFTILFYIIGAFIKIPTWISVVICTLLLGLSLIGILVTDTYREEIEKIETNVIVSNKFMTNLRIDSQSLARKTIDEPLHSELVKFSEMVRYSDPVSSDELADCELEIENKYNELKNLIINNKLEEARKELKTLYILIDERNDKCKATKSIF